MSKPRIVVTGYGPFGSYETNPSSEVVQRLATVAELKEHTDLVTELIQVDYEQAQQFACRVRSELQPDVG